MNERDFQRKLGLINFFMWLPHVFAVTSAWRYLDWWVAILFILGYIFAEKYIGYILDVAALIIAIVVCALTYVDTGDIILIICLIVGVILPWVLRSYFFKMLQKFSED